MRESPNVSPYTLEVLEVLSRWIIEIETFVKYLNGEC